MSIFRRETEPSKPPTPQAPPRAAPRSAPVESTHRVQTHIASGSKVVGEISGAAELVIDGRVEGKIDLDSRLVVGPKGQVKGEVKARSVQISGRVNGNVHGLERVEVLRSGRLEGDMVVPQNGVHIAEGAYFTGNIKMQDSATSTKKEGAERGRESSRPAEKNAAREERRPMGASPAGSDKGTKR